MQISRARKDFCERRRVQRAKPRDKNDHFACGLGAPYCLDMSAASFVKSSRSKSVSQGKRMAAPCPARAGQRRSRSRSRQTKSSKEKIHLCKIDISSSEQSYRPLHFYQECKQSSHHRSWKYRGWLVFAVFEYHE